MIPHSCHFESFFKELWEHEPFPWQRRLAEQVCRGTWPEVIDLPTASGKTACLDIAVFALATQADLAPSERTIGRRIFFVVNRRVIVDEAYERAKRIARRLRTAPPGSVLRAVADALGRLSGDRNAPPLDVAILRGGIYRDNRWARSIAQPTIITSTIDQVGSRLLMRGYGVSEAARPLHAALVAHDSLLLLDEAHISQPFAQTLDAVRRYRNEAWADEPIGTPFHVVPMSATPGHAAAVVFTLDDDDKQHPILKRRLEAKKPTTLVIAKKAKGRFALDELAKEKAVALLGGQRRTVAVIVNRVATARKVYALLKSSQGDRADVHLAIGRMRPMDRDELTKLIQARVGKLPEKGADDRPFVVVATQCLEVGADFDFDAMVSECASLDALRQRFGRLNRKGQSIEAPGCIVIREDQRAAADDPIYGSALAESWKWLESVARDDVVDFGVAAMECKLRGRGQDLTSLLAPRADAPVMLPAYIDIWAQTSPTPAPDPDVALFLHGPQRGEPDVRVCWRSDLPDEQDAWAQTVGLCPPSSPECMPVPIGRVKAWLAETDARYEDRGDSLDAATQEQPQMDHPANRVALAWRGPSESRLIRSAGDVRPGDTLVLPVRSGGWSVFGHVPRAPDDPTDPAARRIDIAEKAFRQSHGRAVLRLASARLNDWPQNEAVNTLKAWINDPETNLRNDKIRDLLGQVAETMPDELAADRETLLLLADRKNGLTWQRYPDPRPGIVLTTRRRIRANDLFLPAMDDGEDETSRITRRERMSLKDHTDHVEQTLTETLPLLAVGPWQEALVAAVRLHDVGKADERFQALLLGGDLTDAGAQPVLWAKSAQLPTTPARRRAAGRRSTLPEGFRHEMLSVQLAESAAARLPGDKILRDLALHLIASHHGRARPLAPVVFDEAPPGVSLPDLGISFTDDERRRHPPPHRLDSGIAERFWTLTRRFGWWGLAYLETVVRLADQQASQGEDEGEFVQTERTATTTEATP